MESGNGPAPSDSSDGIPSVDAILEVDSVEFSYGTVQVLFGVSLVAKPGEMLALLGTNGAGKSTLLRLISGLSPPSKGRVSFDGRDVTKLTAVEMVEAGLVMVPGGKAIFSDMTVMENLEIGAFPIRRSKSLVHDRIAHVIGIFPRLGERAKQPAGLLSGGEQQQLALAKALVLEPQVLCIDELSLGLSPVVIETLLERVRAINAEGKTVILVEQSLNVAAELCERAVFLEKGEVRFEGPTKELLERSDIARAVFLGADNVVVSR